MKNDNKDLAVVNKAQDLALTESLSGAMKNFENIPDESLDNLGGFDREYLQLEIDSKYNFIFTGMDTIEIKGEKVEVVVLNDGKEGGKNYVSGLTVLVNRLRTVTQLPCFVRIITKRFEKSDNGKYLAMDILVVPQTLQK